MPTTDLKRPGEVRIGTWDFVNFPEIAAGDTIASVSSVVCTPSGVTIGSPAFSGSKVTALLTGGTDATRYLFTATVVTTAGRTLQCIGYLAVSSTQ